MTKGKTLVVGSPRDDTVRHAVDAFRQFGLPVAVLDADAFCKHGKIAGDLGDPGSLSLHCGAEALSLGDYRSCYARFVELPVDWSADLVTRARRFDLLRLVIASLPCLVVNHPGRGHSNDSKPHQTALLREHGLRVPRSLSTNDREEALAFIGSCPRDAIYKSNSSERSIVQAFGEQDHARLPLLAKCPVFFQERIRGVDVRVHVVRDRCHALAIDSEAVDYRYDRSGKTVTQPCDIPEELSRLCVGMTAALGLEFSGIDFIRSGDDGQYYCLEVNPMPGYHGYDLMLDRKISRDLAALLASGEPSAAQDGFGAG